ncbi:hypothetical protein [Spirochaeta thermophila]|uniref:Uncharacterized protein n=1 Tax=Winmispira thermophila (strain ATCC 49972 / DSM 6192 / RI 19.B1) TaxID=665571 RepID=E0RTW9_WINT6|nr:hypothetical protein [Spirochaeta thermophila]ADN01025.1 hypothetical protein STHERM_c00490 [Spirochaeta thermophila DSM 6192]
MVSPVGRIVRGLFVCYLVSFVLVMGWAYVMGKAEAPVHPLLAASWRLYEGVADWLGGFLFFHLLSVVLVVGFFSSRYLLVQQDVRDRFRILQGLLVFVVVEAGAYLLLQEGVKPLVIRNARHLEYRTRLAEEFLEVYERAKERGDGATMLQALRSYTRLIPSDESYREELRTLERERPTVEEAGEEEGFPAVPHNLSAGEALRLAEEAFQKEDAYTAYYYARLAHAIEPSLVEARRLQAKAWDAILREEETASSRKDKDFFAAKRQAYERLMEGDYLGAYYAFMRLREERPRDADVVRYYEEAREQVESYAFYYEEIANLSDVGGIPRVFFARRGDDRVDFFYLERVIRVAEGTYGFGVEVTGVGREGSLVYRLRAPYAKIERGILVLHCVGRSDRSVRFLPEREGEVPYDPAFLVPVGLDVDQLLLLGGTGWEGRTLSELFQLVWLPDRVLLPRGEITTLIYIRIYRAVLFLIGSFLVLALAWRGRYRAARRSWGLLVVGGPLVAAAVWWGADMMDKGGARLIAAAMALGGSGAAVAVLVVGSAVLLGLSLLLLVRAMR